MHWNYEAAHSPTNISWLLRLIPSLYQFHPQLGRLQARNRQYAWVGRPRGAYHREALAFWCATIPMAPTTTARSKSLIFFLNKV